VIAVCRSPSPCQNAGFSAKLIPNDGVNACAAQTSMDPIAREINEQGFACVGRTSMLKPVRQGSVDIGRDRELDAIKLPLRLNRNRTGGKIDVSDIEAYDFAAAKTAGKSKAYCSNHPAEQSKKLSRPKALDLLASFLMTSVVLGMRTYCKAREQGANSERRFERKTPDLIFDIASGVVRA
jgi:hypothetical protein